MFETKINERVSTEMVQCGLFFCVCIYIVHVLYFLMGKGNNYFGGRYTKTPL